MPGPCFPKLLVHISPFSIHVLFSMPCFIFNFKGHSCGSGCFSFGPGWSNSDALGQVLGFDRPGKAKESALGDLGKRLSADEVVGQDQPKPGSETERSASIHATPFTNLL